MNYEIVDLNDAGIGLFLPLYIVKQLKLLEGEKDFRWVLCRHYKTVFRKFLIIEEVCIAITICSIPLRIADRDNTALIEEFIRLLECDIGVAASDDT